MTTHGMGFGRALQNVRAALHLSQGTFGARLGVSRRTLTRWECHDELPPIGQRKHIATSFPEAPLPLRLALVRALGLDEAFGASPPESPRAQTSAPLSPASAAAVDGAFLALCEQADVSPGRVRAPLVVFLRTIEAAGLPVGPVRAQLEPRKK